MSFFPHLSPGVFRLKKQKPPHSTNITIGQALDSLVPIIPEVIFCVCRHRNTKQDRQGSHFQIPYPICMVLLDNNVIDFCLSYLQQIVFLCAFLILS